VWNLLARAVPLLSRAEEYPLLLGALKKIWVSRQEVIIDSPGSGLRDTYIFWRLAGQLHNITGAAADRVEDDVPAVIFSRRAYSAGTNTFSKILTIKLKYNYGRLHGYVAVKMRGLSQTAYFDYFRGGLIENIESAVYIDAAGSLPPQKTTYITVRTGAGGRVKRMYLQDGRSRQTLECEGGEYICKTSGVKRVVEDPTPAFDLSGYLALAVITASAQGLAGGGRLMNLSVRLGYRFSDWLDGKGRPPATDGSAKAGHSESL